MSDLVVVPISGGKDSQCCAKLAVEAGKRVVGLFCDTQFEHPITYAHVDRISELYGIEIHRITAGSVPEKVRKYGRFPGGGARHCTDELKIVPSKKWYRAYAEKHGPFEVWYGMRSGESTERANRYQGRVSDEIIAPHDLMPGKYPKYLADLGVMFRLPIIDWTTSEVLAALDGEENPLYREGFERVGCFPCLAAGDPHKERAFAYDDFGRKQYVTVEGLIREIGKPIWTSKGGSQRNNPDQANLFQGCAICAI